MKHSLVIPPRSSVRDADHALESFNLNMSMSIPDVSDIVDMFRNVFPSIRNKLSTIIEGFAPESNADHEIKELNKIAQASKNNILELGIVTYGRTLLPVPEGLDFNVKFLQYLESLESLSQEFDEGVREILTEYKIVVSTFVSDKEARTSVKDHSLFYKTIEKKRAKLTESMSSYFNNKINRARVPLSEIYDQTEDVYKAVDIANRIHKARKRADLEGIRKHAGTCIDILDMVIEQTEKNALDRISKAAAMDLANGAMEMGRWLELVSVYHFRLDQATTTVKQQVEILSKFR